MKKRRSIRWIAALLFCLAALGCQARETENLSSGRTEGSSSSASESGFSPEERSLAEEQASILAAHLASGALDNSSIEGSAPGSDREISEFILTLSRYLEEPAHPYHDFITRTPELVYLFPRENVRQIAYELFGVEDWDMGDRIPYYEEKQQYESGLEFGFGMVYSCKDVEAKVLGDDDVVEAVFLLTDNVGFEGEPGWEEHGIYKIAFQMMREDDRVFLRYKGIQPSE